MDMSSFLILLAKLFLLLDSVIVEATKTLGSRSLMSRKKLCSLFVVHRAIPVLKDPLTAPLP